MMPCGVHGSGAGSPRTSLPRLTGAARRLLGRVHQAQHGLSVQARGQRKLDDVAGAGRVGVQLGDHVSTCCWLAVAAGRADRLDAHLGTVRCLALT